MKFSLAAVCPLLLASTVSAAPPRPVSRSESTTPKPNPHIGSNLPIHARSAGRLGAPARPPTFNASTESIAASNATKMADGREYFSNWAGAIWVWKDITEVQGTTVIPTIGVPAGGDVTQQYGGTVWVGIDGDTCGNAILQTGVDWVIENGEVTYNAWYEWFPAPLTAFDNFPVHAGDVVSMRVVATSTTSGAAYIINETTGQNASMTFEDQPALCLQNAEWIVEDFSTGGGLVPFASFGPVNITHAQWTASSVDYTLDYATSIDIEQQNHVLTNCNLDGPLGLTCTYVPAV